MPMVMPTMVRVVRSFRRDSSRRSRMSTYFRCGWAAWLEHDDGRFARSALREAVDVLTPAGVFAEAGPQSLPLRLCCNTGADLSPAVGQVDRRVRHRLEVQPPGRFFVAPAVHGEGHKVRAVFVVADDRHPRLAGPSSGGRQSQ